MIEQILRVKHTLDEMAGNQTSEGGVEEIKLGGIWMLLVKRVPGYVVCVGLALTAGVAPGVLPPIYFSWMLDHKQFCLQCSKMELGVKGNRRSGAG